MRISLSLTVLFSFLLMFPVTAAPDAVDASAKKDVWALAKEKSKLTREMDKLFRTKKIKDDALNTLKNEAVKASMAFMKARKSHPDLKTLNQASDKAQKQMMKAMMAKEKDKEATSKSRSDYVNAQRGLQKASQNIPEIVALQKKAIEANDAVQAKKLELVSKTPEGKVLAEKVKALDAQIAEFQKKL